MYSRYRDQASAQTHLENDMHGEPADQRLQVAVTALLWHMAHIDGALNQDELKEVISSIEHEFHLMDAEAGQILEVAEFLLNERPRTEEFIGVLNTRLDDIQRQHFYEMSLRVANADGYIDAREETFAHTLKEQLKLAA